MNRLKLIDSARKVLRSRSFNNEQIDKIIPTLQDDYLRQPECLAEIVDTWNMVMGSAGLALKQQDNSTPAIAKPPAKSILRDVDIDMTTILAEVEPNLLKLNPQKLVQRHIRIKSLGIANNVGDEWVLLFNAPRGFYLQDWVELSKKIYYIEQKVVDFLYDKKEQKEMTVHPIVKAAKAVECDFDVIRARYLFALRTGYRSLSHMSSVQTALSIPTIADLLLSDDKYYLSKFAPFCSLAELSCFSDLIKNHELDQDDAEIYQELAELNALTHQERSERRKRVGGSRDYDEDDEVD